MPILTNQDRSTPSARREEVPHAVQVGRPGHELPGPVVGDVIRQATQTPLTRITPATMLTLQRTIGNRAALRLLSQQSQPTITTGAGGVVQRNGDLIEALRKQRAFATGRSVEEVSTREVNPITEKMRRRIEHRLAQKAKFNTPEFIEKRAQHKEARRTREEAEQKPERERLERGAGWETEVGKERAKREKITAQTDALVEQGLDGALLCNIDGLKTAYAALESHLKRNDVDQALEALAEVETQFAAIKTDYETVEDLDRRLNTVVVSAKKQKAFERAKAALEKRTTTPWAEFVASLPDIERQTAALEETQARREAMEEASAASATARETAKEFRKTPTTTKLQQQLTAGLVNRGMITRTYKSSWDSGPGEFSVEYTVKGLKDIVIHAHCDANGTPKAGNGSHWKWKSEASLAGASHELTPGLRSSLINASDAKRHRDSNPAINTR